MDVFLLDLQGPPRNLHWLPRLHARRPDTRFLALTPPARVPSQDARLESTGYTEQIDGASSPDALLAALKGTPSAAPSSPTSPTTLTPRESEVLRLMACGHSNKAIARALDLSEYTVKNHVKQVLRKLGARNRTQAALWMRTAAP
ncbi:response regulator transcription factor [Deinococcus hopiensis]|uniref:response regulator transcription factor n=1 Tax=Deinococcus hopiensis TaxID=309885 RepID=UPI000A068430|nr:response regulator transcription factor [Deinococcus hopiensis]